MKNTLFALVGAMLLLTACNINDPTKVCPVAGRTYACIEGSDSDVSKGYDTIRFYSNGQCREVSYLDERLWSTYDYYYTMQDTTLTLYFDKHHKELNDFNGTFFYHDTVLVRWVKDSKFGTYDSYDIYTEVK